MTKTKWQNLISQQIVCLIVYDLFFEIYSSLRRDFVHDRELSRTDRKLSILPSAYDFILPAPGKPKQCFRNLDPGLHWVIYK
jgi:hypothetical protein